MAGSKDSSAPVADPRWTARRRRAVLLYVPELAAALRLADWDIRVDFTVPAPSSACATVTPSWAQKRAVVRFGPTFLDLSAGDQQHTLVHELLHCHLFGVHEAARRVIAAAPVAARPLARSSVNFEVEAAADALADAVWPLLPKFDLELEAARPVRLAVVPTAAELAAVPIRRRATAKGKSR